MSTRETEFDACRDPNDSGDLAVLRKAVAATSAILTARDAGSLFRALDESCRLLGFEVFLLACHKTSWRNALTDPAFTTIPRSFLVDFERFGIERLFQSSQGFFANTMRSGLMVPVSHRPDTVSVFALVTTAKSSFGRGIAEMATIVGNAAVAKTDLLRPRREASVSAAAAAERRLSAPQSAILDWIAEGKSNLDIGAIMGMNERTVRYHVSEILRKLDVASRTQAATIRRSAAFDRHHLHVSR